MSRTNYRKSNDRSPGCACACVSLRVCVRLSDRYAIDAENVAECNEDQPCRICLAKAPIRTKRSEELSEVPAGRAARRAFPTGLTNRDFSLIPRVSFSLSLSLSLLSITLSHHRSCTHQQSYRRCRCYTATYIPSRSCIPLRCGAIETDLPPKRDPSDSRD